MHRKVKNDYLIGKVPKCGAGRSPAACATNGKGIELTRPPDLGHRQQGVHRSGAEALHIEGDELEAQRFEDSGELGGHLRGQRTWQFFAGDFDAHDVPVMPHPALPEAQCAKRILCPARPCSDFRGSPDDRIQCATTGTPKQACPKRAVRRLALTTRMSCLVSPASSRGAATVCCRAAACPGRKSP